MRGNFEMFRQKAVDFKWIFQHEKLIDIFEGILFRLGCASSRAVVPNLGYAYLKGFVINPKMYASCSEFYFVHHGKKVGNHCCRSETILTYFVMSVCNPLLTKSQLGMSFLIQ
jgi:hypothetical protein